MTQIQIQKNVCFVPLTIVYIIALHLKPTMLTSPVYHENQSAESSQRIYICSSPWKKKLMNKNVRRWTELVKDNRDHGKRGGRSHYYVIPCRCCAPVAWDGRLATSEPTTWFCKTVRVGVLQNVHSWCGGEFPTSTVLCREQSHFPIVGEHHASHGSLQIFSYCSCYL